MVADYKPYFLLAILRSQHQLKVGGEPVLFSVKPLFLDTDLPSRQLVPPKLLNTVDRIGGK